VTTKKVVFLENAFCLSKASQYPTKKREKLFRTLINASTAGTTVYFKIFSSNLFLAPPPLETASQRTRLFLIYVLCVYLSLKEGNNSKQNKCTSAYLQQA